MNEEYNKYTDKLNKIMKWMPEVCKPFLMETGTEMATSTRYSYATELRWFFKYLIDYNPEFEHLMNTNEFQVQDIRKITAQDISQYLSQDKDKGKAERTVARRKAAISRFFSYLVANQIVGYNPVQAAAKVKLHKSEEVVYIDILEQRRMLSAIETGAFLTKTEQKYHTRYKRRDIALISLILDTGIRVSELRGIDIKDIDFKNCSIYILRKGGNKQYVYFSDKVGELIKEYIEERKRNGLYFNSTDPLFITLKGERMSVRAIQALVSKYASSSIPGKGNKITPHKLRASFAMEYYDSTKDILALQKKMGHKSITTTNIYAKATNQKMQDTRNVLEVKRATDDKKEEPRIVDAIKTLVDAGMMTKTEAAVRLNVTIDEINTILQDNS